MGSEWALPDVETLVVIRALLPLSGLGDLARRLIAPTRSGGATAISRRSRYSAVARLITATGGGREDSR
jgi:hypothetical protein